jgi:hypothetical protein
MIVNEGDRDMPDYHLYCDECEDEPNEFWDDFYDVVDWKKDEGKELGWTTTKNKQGQWMDLCPDCNPWKKNEREKRQPIKRRVK